MEAMEPEMESAAPPVATEEWADADGDAPAAPKPRPRPRPAIPPGRPPANTDLVREMHNEDDRDLRSWIDSLAGDSEVRVTITRKRPTIGSRGENIGGVLETVEERIDEEYIRDTWGGGDFQLKIQTHRPNGQWKYFRARSLKLAGPAKMSGKIVSENDASTATPISSTPEHDPLAERAFLSMERHAREAQQRADRAEELARDRRSDGGLDVAALSALQAPMIEQLRSAQETIAGLQRQVIELVARPAPRDEFRDRIMENALAGEGKRVETLREQYEMRIDKLRDNFDDERKRLEDRHQAEIKRLEDRHERELRFREKQEDATNKTADVAHNARLDAAQETIKRLERELTAMTAKNAALEAKKDQTIGEKADELIKVKEALDGLGGDGDDGDKPWYTQLVDAVGNSEAAVNWINKITGGGGGGEQPQPQQQALPPPGVPYQVAGDANIYVRNAQGQVGIVDAATATRMQARARKRARRQAQRPADPGVAAAQASEAVAQGEPSNADLDAALAGEPTPEPEPAPVQVKVRKPSRKEIEQAVQFAEAALRGGDSDEKIVGFAATARNLMPGDVLAYIQSVGSETFITEATKSIPGSPLATIRGRGWLRKVVKVLVEGSL
jgi:hypothetical protein